MSDINPNLLVLAEKITSVPKPELEIISSQSVNVDEKTPNIFINITPNSLMAVSPEYKFRKGCKENEVTQFSPYSDEFTTSFQDSVLRIKLPVSYGARESSLPLFLRNKNFMSLGLNGYNSLFNEHFITMNGAGFIDVDLSSTGLTNSFFPKDRNEAFYELRVDELKKRLAGKKSFSEIISFFTRIWASTEEIETNIANIHREIWKPFHLGSLNYSLKNGCDKANTPCCRLVNIYEPIKGKSYCFSFLVYAHSTIQNSKLFHVWVNEHSYQTETNPGLLCSFYLGRSFPYLLANMLFRQVGIEIDPMGFAKVHIKVDGKDTSFISNYALRILEDFYNIHVTAGGPGRSLAVPGGNFNLNGLGLTVREPNSRRNSYLIESPYYNRLSPILKALGSTVRSNSYGLFNPDPIKLRNAFLNFLNDRIKAGDSKNNDFVGHIGEIISSIKIQRCWEEMLVTRQNQMVEGKLIVNSLDLQSFMGRPGFADKLVFA